MDSVNKFTKMNMDLDKSILPEDSYYKGLNVRPITTEGLSTGALVNIKGNEYSISIPDTNNVWSMIPINPSTITTWAFSTGTVITDTGVLTANLQPSGPGISGSSALMDAWTLAFEAIGLTVYRKDPDTIYVTSQTINITSLLSGTVFYTITNIVPVQKNLQLIGWEELNNNIYLITTPDTTSNPGGIDPSITSTPSSTGQIWKLAYNDVDLTPTLTLLYNNYLNLTTQHPIANPGAIVGRYENQNIQRLYWTDYFNSPKTCNVADPNLFAIDPTIISLQSAIDFAVPKLESISTGGQLQCGIYQFAYRLKNNGGAVTVFSNFSNLVHIVNTDENSVQFQRYEGTPTSTISNKKISMSITGVDTDYDRIEVIRLYSSSLNQLSPIIDIIFDEDIPKNGIYNFVYADDNSTTPITLTESLVSGVSFNKVKSIASKNNILFFLNTKEENFDLDYDARAFRWQWSNFDAIGTGTMTWANPLPDTGNDINPNQTPDFDGINQPYLYQKYAGSGVPVLGGTGTNISYTFDTEGVHLDNRGLSGVNGSPFRATTRTSKTYSVGGNNYQHVNFFEDFHSPYIDNLLRGYQRDETYRFGIVFFNKQGYSSFVKWIADIRMPHMWMPDPTTGVTSTKTLQFPTSREFGALNVSADTYGLSLCVKFNINIPPAISKVISGFSIVRVQRTQDDKTILGQGLIYPTQFQAGTMYLVTNTGGPAYDNKCLTLQSPEFLFGVAPKFTTGDTLDILCAEALQTRESARKAINFNAIPEISVSKWTTPFDCSYRSNGTPIPIASAEPISSFAQNQNNQLTQFGITVTNQCPSTITIGPKTTVLFGNFDTSGISVQSRYTTDFVAFVGRDFQYLANYKKIVTNQYGGNTLSQRSVNEYISCGHYQNVNTTTSTQNFNYNIFGGDTYITEFDNVSGFKNWFTTPGGEHGFVDYFPVETCINTELRIGTPYKAADGSITYGVANKGNFPDTGEGIDIDEEFNLVSAHMTEPIIKKYFPKPIPFSLQNENLNRIYASEPKLNGELLDSWSDIKSNSFIDVSGQYGPIINGIINKDRLYFFQERGIGIAAVNERALLDSNITTQNVQLGTAGVLSRYDYVSTNVGSKHQHGFTNTDNAIYFFDIDNKTIYKLSDELTPLSDIKYVSSQLRNKLNGHIKINDNPVFYNIQTGGFRNGVLLTYDYQNKEVFCTFLDSIQSKTNTNNWTEDKFTLVFNERADAFTSFYSHFPAQYINTKNKLLSPATSVKKWQFDDNFFYGAGFVGFLSNQTHSFIVGDKIQIQQFPGFSNTSYNGYATITFIPNSNQIVTDLVFGVSTPPQGGIAILPKNNDLYIHNIGDYGKFYGTIFNSELTFISNKYSNDIKVFNNLELFTESLSISGTPEFSIDVPGDTFNAIRCYNDYQNSDYQPIVFLGKRNERVWNLKIPNNRVTYTNPNPNFNIFDQANISPTRKAYSDRLRSNHLFVDLLYNNTNNYKLTLHQAKVLFEKSYS